MKQNYKLKILHKGFVVLKIVSSGTKNTLFRYSDLVTSVISRFEYKVNLLNKGLEAFTVVLLKIKAFQALNLRIKYFLFRFSRCEYTGSFLFCNCNGSIHVASSPHGWAFV
jgi:hypothetical protein